MDSMIISDELSWLLFRELVLSSMRHILANICGEINYCSSFFLKAPPAPNPFDGCTPKSSKLLRSQNLAPGRESRKKTVCSRYSRMKPRLSNNLEVIKAKAKIKLSPVLLTP